MQTGLPTYRAAEYQADIDRDTEALQTTTDPKERRFLHVRINAAKAYITDPSPTFKW